jgi:hypothetical protein
MRLPPPRRLSDIERDRALAALTLLLSIFEGSGNRKLRGRALALRDSINGSRASDKRFLARNFRNYQRERELVQS